MATLSPKEVDPRAWRGVENAAVIVDAVWFEVREKLENECRCVIKLVLSWFKRAPA